MTGKALSSFVSHESVKLGGNKRHGYFQRMESLSRVVGILGRQEASRTPIDRRQVGLLVPLLRALAPMSPPQTTERFYKTVKILKIVRI